MILLVCLKRKKRGIREQIVGIYSHIEWNEFDGATNLQGIFIKMEQHGQARNNLIPIPLKRKLLILYEPQLLCLSAYLVRVIDRSRNFKMVNSH